MLVVLHHDRFFGSTLARLISAQRVSGRVRSAADTVELNSWLERGPGGIAIVDEAAFASPAALEAFIHDRPETRFAVIMVGRQVPDAVRYLDAGAVALVEQADALGTMRAALDAVEAGMCALPRPVLQLLLRHYRATGQAGASQERLARLSPRELEIVEHLASGHDPATIAAELSVSVHTVRSHLKQAFRKLGVHSSVEAVVVAMSAGIAPEAPTSGLPRAQGHHG